MKPNVDTAAQKIEPCHHMEMYVSALSDDSLSGPARWYTKLHILYCARCRAALQALQTLRNRLRGLGGNSDQVHATTLTSDRHSALEKAMDEIDQKERK